jgi:hypothetical protein
MSDERDPLLEEIGATLSVQPSTAFVARVRAEVASERMRWPWRAHLVVAVPVVLAMTVAGAVGVRREVHGPMVLSVPSASSPRAHEMAAAVPRSVLPAAEESASKGTQRRSVGIRPRSVILAADEVAAFWDLVAAIQTDDPTIPPARWTVSETTGEIEPLPEIAAIELPPVTVEPLPTATGQDDVGGTDE